MRGSRATRRRTVLAGAFAVALVFGPAEAQADDAASQGGQGRVRADDRYIEVCNKSSRAISVARATSAREDNASGEHLFISEGWWNLESGECERMWGPPLANRYYYVYAEAEGGTWEGTYNFCVRKEKFLIKDAQCGRGWERRNFNRIDTQEGDPEESIRYSFTD